MTRFDPAQHGIPIKPADLIPGDQAAVVYQDHVSVFTVAAPPYSGAGKTYYVETSTQHRGALAIRSDDPVYLLDRPFAPEPGTVVTRRVPGHQTAPPIVWLYARNATQWTSLTAPMPHSLSLGRMRAEYDAGNVTILFTPTPPAP